MNRSSHAHRSHASKAASRRDEAVARLADWVTGTLFAVLATGMLVLVGVSVSAG